MSQQIGTMETEESKPKPFMSQFESIRIKQIIRPRHNGRVEYELRKNGEIYTLSVELNSGIKEGPAVILHEGILVVSLNFVNNEVNGDIIEYEDTIPIFQGFMKNGLREGVGTEWDTMGRVIFFGLYQNGERLGSLVPSQYVSGFYDCYKNNKLIMVCQIQDNKLRGLCCLFENGAITSILEYSDNMTAFPKKKFAGNTMEEYEDNVLVYSGEYANDLRRLYPREGSGTMLKNNNNWFIGEWKDNVPNGKGTLLLDDPVEGTWKRGYCKMEGDNYLDYETGEVEEALKEQYLSQWNNREAPVIHHIPKKLPRAMLNMKLLIAVIVVVLLILVGVIIIVVVNKNQSNNREYVVTTIGEFNAVKYQAVRLRIPSDTFNDRNASYLRYDGMNNLRSLVIENNTFTTVEQFVIDGLPQLESIEIGNASFTLTTDLSVTVGNLNKKFSLINCPNLKSVSIGSYSFLDFAGACEFRSEN